MNPRMGLPWLAFLREWGKALGWLRTPWVPCLSKKREELWVLRLRPHHTGPPVVAPRLIGVNGEVIQSPGEGEVHGGVVGGVALQGHVVSQVDVGTRRGQSDLGCICQENQGERFVLSPRNEERQHGQRYPDLPAAPQVCGGRQH